MKKSVKKICITIHKEKVFSKGYNYKTKSSLFALIFKTIFVLIFKTNKISKCVIP